MNNEKKCFVLMPFDKKYREVYDEVYKPICKEKGLRCWRVDEIHRPGSITRDIIQGIIDADIIIADLTSRNPNVFYELGIAHSAGNKTIMTSQNKDDVPFDVSNYRVIFYEQTITGSKKLFAVLGLAIQDLLTALDQTNNPFQDMLSTRSSLSKRIKTPLTKYIDIYALPKGIREWLTNKGIFYAEEINKINWAELKKAPGIGSISLGRFIAQVLDNDLYDNAEVLQKFIMERGIRLRR